MNVDLTYRSPNHSSRDGKPITMIVLHATVGNARSALAWLTNPAARVSAHYVIDKAGAIYQLVPDELTAWHAGRAAWRGETAVNEVSIGIELENANDGRDPYPAAQIAALVELVREKVARYGIAPDMITRHVDVALPRGRKSDPAGFPWVSFLKQVTPEREVPPEVRPRPEPPIRLRDGLANALLAEAFRQVGAAGQQHWSLARAAAAQQLGMPVGPTFEFRVGSRIYTGQSFGRDTLIAPLGDPRAIERLSKIHGGVGGAQRALADEALVAVYRQAGERYHDDWAMHQEARRAPIGAPLDRGQRLMVVGQEYVAACYTLDVLYSPVNRWSTVGRFTQLAEHGEQSALRAALYNRWCARVGVPARQEWTLHQEALRSGLGAPLGPSFRIHVDGRTYAAEAFALDVLACEIGNWGTVYRLGELLTLPEGGVLASADI